MTDVELIISVTDLGYGSREASFELVRPRVSHLLGRVKPIIVRV